MRSNICFQSHNIKSGVAELLLTVALVLVEVVAVVTVDAGVRVAALATPFDEAHWKRNNQI